MVIRLLRKEEHADYFKWYDHLNAKSFPAHLGSENIIGVDQDGELGAGIMVQPIDAGAFCMFSFITRNPFCDRDFSSKAVDFLLQGLPEATKLIGYKFYISFVSEEPAKKRFRKNGIQELGQNFSLFGGRSSV